MNIVQKFGSREYSGVWLPALTLAIPGDLSVVYSAQEGEFYVLNDMCELTWRITATTFTFSTGGSDVQITGSPFAAKTKSGWLWGGRFERFRGITKANYQNFVPSITNGTSIITIEASGSGQTEGKVSASDFPTAGVKVLYGSIRFPLA